ncbi:uncharacterized protein LOC120076257 [Benincasa hispida]|uniref:uncharacterized protein LOC120076257 n=1 Tax=Benincasa hispida TaxID=102211 RepID=UPI0019001EC6|nr:uncharacterized protein LOC120076257 [Benincasa hispida]
MTIVENDKGEMVPMRVQNGWRMCIDFRKLNEFDGNDDFGLWNAKIKDILGQQRAYKAFLDLSTLPPTLTAQEREDMELTAYGTLVLNLSDNILRQMDSTKPLSDNLDEFKTTVYEFKRLGKKIGNENEAFVLLNSLPEAYKEVKNASTVQTSENGITRHKTVRYTPQQNGVVERLNRTIMERVRYFLSDTILSENYWVEATAYTVYTLNRCPYTSLEFLTLEEKWTNHPPNLDNLKVFGCVGFVHQNKGKLKAKVIKCMFVGFTEGVKGYKMWHPVERKFIVSRDITFRAEETFM